MSLFSAIVLLIVSCAVLIIAGAAIIGIAAHGNSKPSVPRKKNPIDKHMDDNYADIDWLRKGKL